MPAAGVAAKAALQPIFHDVLEMEVQRKEFAHTTPYTREQFLKMTLDVMAGGKGQNEAEQFLAPALWAMTARDRHNRGIVGRSAGPAGNTGRPDHRAEA